MQPERERRLFFCQIEALETAIYITEVAGKYGDAWIENELREFNRTNNPDLFRIAFKMATGGGKTVGDGDADRLARPQQVRQPAGRPILRRVPRRHAPASPSATAYGCCCRTTRTTPTACSTSSPATCVRT